MTIPIQKVDDINSTRCRSQFKKLTISILKLLISSQTLLTSLSNVDDLNSKVAISIQELMIDDLNSEVDDLNSDVDDLSNKYRFLTVFSYEHV